ncbi:M23 family metallopeptidase [Microlunatus spumicola]|uniref:M23 family metallopeptidase n=1 Tax=Microlunatus spumicola TaxID=81499 RepID=A0ABP6WYM5_9ACTN
MPDLPRVLTDAPVADDLPSGEHRGQRPSRLGGRLHALGVRVPSAVLTGALVVALTAGLLVSTAQADDLTDQRNALKQQISRSKSDLTESSAALSNAGVQVDQAASRLASAQAELSRAQGALTAAKAEDVRLAAKLKRAQTDLAKAKAAVLDCQERLDAKKQMVGVIVRNQYQQQTNLMPIAVLTSSSTANLATRMQWATTMLDTTQSKIDELLALEAQLKAKRSEMAKAEQKVAKDREEAADSLAETRRLEAQASAAATAVAGQLVQQQAVERAAAQDVAQDKQEYEKLTAERATVEHRIAVRVAKEKAAAKAAEAKAAAERREAQAKAERRARAEAKAAAKDRAKAPKRTSRSSTARVAAPKPASRPSSTRSTSSSGAHHGFIYPVTAPITSPYGMRLHPVTHIWKLHDGTDFGAGCGTAIKAAYSGVVAEKYYNAGYGNRLMIDHGKVDGKYVTTGYNHAIRYVVGVGDHVRQGQTIGYVGTTGYSTGCHLHLMVWLNGGMVNPMTWY